MGFSILSLAITVLAMLSQKKIVHARDFVSIEFDITGPSIMENKASCKNRVKSIQYAFGSLLGLNDELIEIIRPTAIKQGLKLCVNIYINNTKAIDMNIEKDVKEANEKGDLQGIIKDAWNLSSTPIISNIKYTKHDSRERKERTVSLKMVKTNSEHHIATEIKMSSIKNHQEDREDNLFAEEVGTHESDILMMNSLSQEVELPPMIPPIIEQTVPRLDEQESQSSSDGYDQMPTTGTGNSGETVKVRSEQVDY